MIRKEDWLVLCVSLSFLLLPLVLFYAELPHVQSIPIHWGLSGPDKFVLPSQFPFFLLMVGGLIVVVWGARFVYPLQENVEKFRKVYNGFVLVLSFLLSLLFSASVLWAAGFPVSIDTLVWVIVGAILITAGALMYVSKRNWVAGFRNPWTLSSDRVWDVVNREAGIFTVIIGVLLVLTPFIGGYQMFLLCALLLGYLAFTVHSYLLWRREREE